MPRSSYFQFSTLDPAIPQWHVQYTLAQLARGDRSTFPEVGPDTEIATQAAILARGIQLPPFHLDILVWFYQRLSRPEQVALRLMNLANIGPRDGMVRPVDSDQSNALSQATPNSEPVAGVRDTDLTTPGAFRSDIHHLAANPPENDFDRLFQDFTGDFSNNRVPPSLPISEITYPIPSQSDTFCNPQPPSFTFTPAEQQVIGGDYSGDMAFLDFGKQSISCQRLRSLCDNPRTNR